MTHFIRFTLLFLASIVLITCSSENKQTVSETPVPIEVSTAVGQLSIQDVKTQVLESFPIQVTVTISGTLPKKCQSLTVETTQQNRTFFVTLTAVENTSTCSSADNTFTKTVSLNVDGLKAGIYQVDVHGLTAQFELVVDNIIHW